MILAFVRPTADTLKFVTVRQLNLINSVGIGVDVA